MYVQAELEKRDCIYKGTYAGWYSVPDEAFLTDADVDAAVDNHGNNVKVCVF